MSSYLDKYKTGPSAYLVYYHKGEIKVKRGYPTLSGYPYAQSIFIPEDGNTWMSKCPAEYNKISSRGKVLVEHEEDIPKAKEMIIKHYQNRCKEIQDAANATVSNITKILQ